MRLSYNRRDFLTNRNMNGTERKIEIFRPFGEGVELTKIILFQPFDLRKWFVIGFAAWLANLGGGGGLNYRFDRSETRTLNNFFEQIPKPILVVGICITVGCVVFLIVLFTWLRARGGFMLIDCIVKNRSAIAEPWRYFRKEGNSYFFFSLLVLFGLLPFGGLLSLPFVLPAIRNGDFLRTHDVYLIFAIGAWILVMVLFVLAWALIASFMAPVMYRQRCRASKAFTIVTRLIAAHTGEILLYCLFWIVLALASAMVGCVAACATCCIVAVPYIGTVILLPVFVLLRSFSLLFLRQCGPEYDVWTTSMPPEFAPVLLPLPTARPGSLSSREE